MDWGPSQSNIDPDTIPDNSAPDYMAKLREFHIKYGHYMAEVPHVPDGATIDLRMRLVQEECDEFMDACRTLIEGPFTITPQDGVTQVADALADILYVVFGSALAFGIPIGEIFTEVHRSNMSKSTEKNEYGKTIKGPNWSPPNIIQFIDTPNFGEE